MARLDISLLGTLHVARDGLPVKEPAYGKALALLAWLAVESDRAHHRSRIAGILWPDFTEERARHNLRQALATLRRIAGAEGEESCLLVHRDIIAFNPTADAGVDVHRLLALLAERDRHTHAEPARCLPCTRRLEAAIGIYKGDFLQGFSVPDSEEFEAWLTVWRERLRERVLAALDDLVASYRAQGDPASAINALRRQLEIDPLREPAHRALMTLLWESGERTAALAQYARCSAILDEELGLEPEEETTALYEAIREGDASPPPASGSRKPTSQARIPAPTTRMIGREVEAAEVIDHLAREDCRLLTITGPGGSGKTRLALHVAATMADRFPGITCFVELASARDGEEMARAIAGELGLHLRGKDPPDRQLLGWLRERSVLLVLDNLEQLVDEIDLIPAMLAHVPDLTLLATSRERLNLSGEWVYPIRGLTVPRGPETDDVEGYEAVELFVDGLRRARGGQPLRHEERPEVVHICRLVDGMPLALNLAAAWANSLTLEEISDGIRQNIDFLSASSRDQPERHRSMRAVLLSTWERLTAEEQTAWRRLSVFEESFALAAAERVGKATMQVLAALVNKSVLMRTEDGRYRMHGLLRQFGDEMLRRDEPEHTRIRDRHSHYYLRMLGEMEDMLTGRDQPAALRQIDSDEGNIRLAGEWAIQRGMFNDLVVAGPAFWLFLVIHGQMARGAQAFGTVLDALERVAPRPDGSGLALGMARAYTGGFRSGLGQYDEAIALLTSGTDLLRDHVNGRVLGLALNMLATALLMKGRYDEAHDRLLESIEEFERLGDAWGQAFSLNDLGMVQHMYRNDDAGERSCERSRSMFRRVGDNRGQAFAATSLGRFAMMRGDYARARRLHHEALSLREEVEDAWGVASSCVQLGRVAALMDNEAQARHFLLRALSVGWETSIAPVVLEALTELAGLDMTSGEPDSVRETLEAISRHPALPAPLVARVVEIAGDMEPMDGEDGGAWAVRAVNDVARSLIGAAS
jgi:predicted ATPase/DNA-binding SARP family transcriptional activator